MGDHRVAIIAVMTVQLNTATAHKQYTSVHVDAGLTGNLVSTEVSVVRGFDEIMRQRVVKVLQMESMLGFGTFAIQKDKPLALESGALTSGTAKLLWSIIR